MLAVENQQYPGYFEIPGCKRYCISKEAKILDKVSRYTMSTSMHDGGYIRVALINDDFEKKHYLLHRVMCIVFKKPPHEKIEDLHVNHKDGNKANNSIDNLEWCTPQENQLHAGRLNLTRSCLPVLVRNVDTGVVTEYESAKACALALKLTTVSVLYKIRYGAHRVYEDRCQYKSFHDNAPWVIPSNPDKEILKYGKNKKVLVRDVVNNDIMKFDKIVDACEFINVSPSVLTKWLNVPGQYVINDYYQVKFQSDDTPWREVYDLLEEFEKTTKHKVIVTINDITRKVCFFKSLHFCAKFLNVKLSALSYRVTTNGQAVFNDGNRYVYYSVYKQIMQGPNKPNSLLEFPLNAGTP